MATVTRKKRPLSPHLGIYRWGPAMLVSILHRATGSGMATIGALLLVGWLAALAGGAAQYAAFIDWFTRADCSLNMLGYVIGIGLTLSLFQHMASGVRHLFLDAGANFELRSNRTSAAMTMAASIAATIAFWAYLTVGK